MCSQLERQRGAAEAVELRPTTSAQVAAEFLRSEHEVHVLLCTYQSSELLREDQALQRPTKGRGAPFEYCF